MRQMKLKGLVNTCISDSVLMAYVHSNVHMKGTRWAGFCLSFLFNIIFSIFHKKHHVPAGIK